MTGYCPDCGNTLCICDDIRRAEGTGTMTAQTTHPTGSPQDSRPTTPATADGAGRLSADVPLSLIRRHAEADAPIPASWVRGLLAEIDRLRAGLLELVDERDSYKSQADDLAFSCRQTEAALATAERERERDVERSRIDWKTVAHRYRRAAREVGKSWLTACDDMGELLDRLQQAEAALAASESRARALREALEGARHHLVTLNGLYATDKFDAYQDALENGCDSNGAYDALCEVVWVIEEQATIASIDAALAAASDGPGAAPSGEASDWQHAPSVNLLTGMLPPTPPAQGSDQEGA